MPNTTYPLQPDWVPSPNLSHDDVRELATKFAADLRTIAAELQAEARRRNWCGDYQDFIDRVNGRTSRSWLGPMTTPKRMSINITVDYDELPLNWSDNVRSRFVDDVSEAARVAANNRAVQSSGATNVRTEATSALGGLS